MPFTLCWPTWLSVFIFCPYSFLISPLIVPDCCSIFCQRHTGMAGKGHAQKATAQLCLLWPHLSTLRACAYGRCCFYCGNPLLQNETLVVMLSMVLSSFVPKGRKHLHGSTGLCLGLSDSDVRKCFSDFGNLSPEKCLGQSISCIFLLLLITAGRKILFRKVACPWLLGVRSFSSHPVAHGFVTMQNHSSFSLEEEESLINGCLRKMECIC